MTLLKTSDSVLGLLPVNKPSGRTSFNLVSLLRRTTGVQTIGHAGTLDPFATGVMVMLIGRPYTKLSAQFLNEDKEYRATVRLGISTDSFDCDGQTLSTSDKVPSLQEIETALLAFQGTILQTPPMFSAKKIGGKKLYELARKGVTIERAPVSITLQTQLIAYNYPFLEITVACSKGTYIRSIADDLGKALGCGAHLSALCRTRSGRFTLDMCCDISRIADPSYRWTDWILAR